MARTSMRLTGLLAGLAPWSYVAASPEGSGVERAFEDFVAKFGKSYATAEERLARFFAFADNFARIEAANAKSHSFRLGVNEFADQTPKEFAAGRFGFGSKQPEKPFGELPHLGTHSYSGLQLPAAVDWVSKGAVTMPKNQQQCGSCWSFSSTGALEGAWQIASGNLVSLSEQQLVDCATKDNNGCNGGLMDHAFTFLEDKAVCTEESYPYEAKDGTCRQSKCKVGIPKGSVTGFKDVQQNDMQALMEAVAQQPVSVAIEADESAFQLYQSGILTQECGSKLDHGVLLVGYGTENGVDYWKIKNSWGGSWGESGYIRIKRGVPAAGECGIKANPSYPVVSKSSQAAALVV